MWLEGVLESGWEGFRIYVYIFFLGFFGDCFFFYFVECIGGGVSFRVLVGFLFIVFSFDWSVLCFGCVFYSFLVTGLLFKMGSRLVRVCVYVLCISSLDKVFVCGSRVG